MNIMLTFNTTGYKHLSNQGLFKKGFMVRLSLAHLILSKSLKKKRSFFPQQFFFSFINNKYDIIILIYLFYSKDKRSMPKRNVTK